jgi:diguanylate cyclase (GGDEF)-like protein
VRHDDRFFLLMQDILDKMGYWQGEVWNQRKDGEVYPEWLGVSAVSENGGRAKYYVYIFSDMSERLAAQERIEFLAHHDPLTGLPNRLLLRDRAEQAQAQAARMQSRVALMFLDLDRFKTINDSLGHPVGDALLLAVVERLKTCVRDSDTISRQGGDEFIILLNDVRDSEAASRVADKIHQRMSEPILLANQSLISSFSIGIALYPDDGEDFDSLMQKADTAMYHAKESGRNSHRFFTEQMNRKVVEHMTLETQLRRALERNEFVLHYQPQLNLHEGTIIGVEALIRWNNPESGLVPPCKFIPVAEDSGLIVPIGAWVINEACRQAKAWQNAGLPPFVVAVNLSAVQFRQHDLINTVINALVLSDLDSQWLELELTESILIQDAEATLDLVRRLKALGVKLSVDDFGTGYSSLAYLKRFAVDKLKIDQSFIRDLVADPDDAAIVRAIIQMARSLKLTTIAEGVETEELSNLLRLFHCDEIQGYWFARPIPADQLEEFVRAHKVP